jgi:hypothetical protein
MAGTMHVPRSRGAVSGVLLVLLGLWGGLLPFAGPYADFGFAPDEPWVYTADRLQLSVAPAVATAVGGLIVLLVANRVVAVIGAWLAALGGAWFAIGGPVATLWDVPGVGAPLGAEEARRLAEHLSGFTALGVVVVFLAALALGRFAVIGVREAREADYGDGGPGPGRRPGTTQPMAAPTVGRYSREAAPQDAPYASTPGYGRMPDPDDQRVAGERRKPGL